MVKLPIAKYTTFCYFKMRKYTTFLKGVFQMTDMKRTTISLPDELVEALSLLKQTDEFKNASYSEIIRVMIKRGLNKAEDVA